MMFVSCKFQSNHFRSIEKYVYWCNGVLDEFEELASVADCLEVAVEIGPGLGSTSMQIVRDVRIKKTIDNKGNLYGDPFMAVIDLVEMPVEP